jgi:dethiobiotin synthetase
VASFFVTGTDTGVGKTVASTALLAAARARGLCVAALKPLESGSTAADSDAARLADAAGLAVDEVALYRFADPVAPGVGAEREGIAIDFDRIWDRLDDVETRGSDLVLVEGAGGLLVPLGGGRTTADLVRELALPLIVVARDALGTINHTLLTVEVAIARGLPVAGIIVSRGTADPSAAEENLREIDRALAGDPPILGVLPFLHDRTTAALARAGDPLLARLLSLTEATSQQ